MGKFTGFLRSFLLLAAVLAAGILGFLGIKKKFNASSKHGSQPNWQTSPMNKLTKFLKSPAGLAAALIVAVVVAAGVFLLVKKLTTPPKPPEFAATVNGEGIPYSDYQTRLDAQTYFYAEIDPRSPEELVQIQNQVIEDMIQEKLLSQELAKHGITITDEMVRERIQEEVVDVYYHDREDPWKVYADTLGAHYHTTLNEVMRTFRLESLRGSLGPLATKKRLSVIWVQNTAVGGDPERPIPEGKTEAEVNQPKKELAQMLFERVKSGEDFSVLAREFSDHKKSAERGGDLGLIVYPTEGVFVHNEGVGDFPGLAKLYVAVRELGVGETQIYEQFNGHLIARVIEVAEGPLGAGQSFEEWYAALRSKADVSIEKNVMTIAPAK